MKHPIDISTWGEFKVGELFDMFPGRRLKKADFKDGDIPFVMASSYNNGIVTTLANPISTNENFLTADIFGNVFYQQGFVGYGDDNCGLKLKYREGKPNEYLFLATVISSISVQASFTNKLRGTWYVVQTIPLPLKHGTNPADYSQDDIDWDYMEGFMLRVQYAATERLANLPEPGQKSKTPVDTSIWGEFDVIALFDIINTKSIRQSDVQAQLQSNNGSTPYITASDKNNAILAYIECPQEWIDEGNCIFIGGKTTTITYQEKDFCSNDSHNLALYLKNKQARTKHIQLYLVSVFKKTFAKYHWGDALSKTKIKTESIKLPLKPSADPSNYTQDDIDWYYMEQFMEQFQMLAINRLEELTDTYDYDILTV